MGLPDRGGGVSDFDEAWADPTTRVLLDGSLAPGQRRRAAERQRAVEAAEACDPVEPSTLRVGAGVDGLAKARAVLDAVQPVR